MREKVFGVFSGRQLTVLALAAMFVPGALYAVPAFTNVAIEDPNTGLRATVDDQHHLLVDNENPATQPKNFVNDVFGVGNNVCTSVYQVPRNKALVVTEVTMTVKPVVDPSFHLPSSQGLYWGKTGFDCLRFIGGVTTDGVSPYQRVFDPLAPGVPVPAGSIVEVAGSNSNGEGSFHGYLVPADQVPPAGSAELAQLSGTLPLPPSYRH